MQAPLFDSARTAILAGAFDGLRRKRVRSRDDGPVALSCRCSIPSGVPSMSDFYDRMASLYHLIFQDWDESIERQAGQLTGILRERWGTECRCIVDVSCGIGTQAIGLA